MQRCFLPHLDTDKRESIFTENEYTLIKHITLNS